MNFVDKNNDIQKGIFFLIITQELPFINDLIHTYLIFSFGKSVTEWFWIDSLSS